MFEVDLAECVELEVFRDVDLRIDKELSSPE